MRWPCAGSHWPGAVRGSRAPVRWLSRPSGHPLALFGRKTHTSPLISLILHDPVVQRLRRTSELGCNRHDRRPRRGVVGPVLHHHPDRSRTSREYFAVCFLLMIPLSQENEPPANWGRFSLAAPVADQVIQNIATSALRKRSAATPRLASVLVLNQKQSGTEQ